MVVLDPKSQGTISAPVKFTEEDNNEVDEACWDSHKQVGMKTKGGKEDQIVYLKRALKN